MTGLDVGERKTETSISSASVDILRPWRRATRTDILSKSNIANLFVLGQHKIVLDVTGCPAGSGVVSSEVLCSVCDVGSYNLDENVLTECESCDPDRNPNVLCSDGRITISEGIWIGFDDDTIISAKCPLDLGCQRDSGCDYIEDRDALCAENRDPNSTLCSKCMDGYSESVSAEICIECGDGYHREYVALSLLMAVFITVFCMGTNTVTHTKLDPTVGSCGEFDTTTFMGKTKWFYRRLRSQSGDITLMAILQNSIYYEQGVSQILSTSKSSIFLSTFSAIFDVSAQSVASGMGSDPWCFIGDLDAKQKILTDLLAPAFIILFFAITVTFSCTICKPIRFCGKTVKLLSTLMTIFLFIVGRGLATLFKIISCQSIGSKFVHFYFGFEAWYGATWIVALLILISIMIIFGAFFVFGRRLTDKQRYDRNTVIYQLTKRFKPEYWFWEYVLFLRRIIIALFAVGIPGEFYEFVFLIILLIFIWIQWKVNPYLSPEANAAEFTLLICLPIVNVAQISVIQQFAPLIVSTVLSLMIAVPIPVALICAAQVIRKALRDLQPVSTDPDADSDSEDFTDEARIKVVNRVELAKHPTVSIEFADLLSPQFTRGTSAGSLSCSQSYLEDTELAADVE